MHMFSSYLNHGKQAELSIIAFQAHTGKMGTLKILMNILNQSGLDVIPPDLE